MEDDTYETRLARQLELNNKGYAADKASALGEGKDGKPAEGAEYWFMVVVLFIVVGGPILAILRLVWDTFN